jgi:two-component system, sensor histidine kinase and response regulator
LNILTDLLTSAGMFVTASEKGDMVLSLLQQAMTKDHPIELCIIDTQMPKTNGYDIAKKIRNYTSSESENQHSIRNLPLIALFDLSNHNKRKYKDAVFDGFISKPVRKEKLYRMLENAVNRHYVESRGPQQENLNIQNHGKSPSAMKIEADRMSHILLAEDNPINQKLAKMILVKAGYQVETATTGKETFEKYIASSGNFDLILMDMQMPEMDGIEATRLIRNWEEKNERRVPIVALTANAIKGDKEKCIEGGMDDFVTKPINRDLFFEVIEKQLACK